MEEERSKALQKSIKKPSLNWQKDVTQVSSVFSIAVTLVFFFKLSHNLGIYLDYQHELEHFIIIPSCTVQYRGGGGTM